MIQADHKILCTYIFPSGETSWPLPINVKRLIWNAQKTFAAGQPGEITGLNPVEVSYLCSFCTSAASPPLSHVHKKFDARIHPPTYTRELFFSHARPLFHTHTLSLSHTRSLSLSLTHTHSHGHTLLANLSW
jgi:hypothetical protein